MRLEPNEGRYVAAPKNKFMKEGLEYRLTRAFRLLVLKLCGWNRGWAATVLGIHARTITYAVEQYRKEGFEIPSGERGVGGPPDSRDWEKLKKIVEGIEHA